MIDWTKPLVTNAGKPARVLGPSNNGSGNFQVETEWRTGCVYWLNVDSDTGQVCGLADYPEIRNATPAEILAHPDVWPEWQDWAKKNYPPIRLEAAEPPPQPTRDWLTPETAIGARLPCGATVEAAEWWERHKSVRVWFDREAETRGGGKAYGGWVFDLRGGNLDGATPGILPDLIPPAPAAEPRIGGDAVRVNFSAPAAEPQPDGVWVTRAMLADALKTMTDGFNCHSLADALGIPPEPPKVAPWEAAYEAHYAEQQTTTTHLAWHAAVEWFDTEAKGERYGATRPTEYNRGWNDAIDAIRRRIKGDDA